MIFSQKITERGKPDPSECMSFLTARNLVSRIHRICFWLSRVFGSSSGHLRIVFGLFGQRYPADQKARRLWVRDWLCSNWLACVASVSSRGSSRKLGQDRSKKKWMTGEGPPPPSTFFCLRSNVRAITRLETLATQATNWSDHRSDG